MGGRKEKKGGIRRCAGIWLERVEMGWVSSLEGWSPTPSFSGEKNLGHSQGARKGQKSGQVPAEGAGGMDSK